MSSASGKTGLLSQPDVPAVAAAIRRHVPDVISAYLFGSFARGDQRRESDLDIAVLTNRELAPLERFEAAASIARELGNDVDLIDLRRASAVLRCQAVAHGKRIIGGDSREAAVFEDFVYADYARLNEERAGILEDVMARGSIRGR